jgi:hypothetical protein
MTVISALRRLRQEDHEFMASLGCTARPSQMSQKRKKPNYLLTPLAFLSSQ